MRLVFAMYGTGEEAREQRAASGARFASADK
jgi:hypothetical protein